MKDLAQEAIDVQDACNLSGVVGSWFRACSELWDNGRAGNIPNFTGTDTINRHPIQFLYVSKVMSLTGTGINQDEFSRAYTECRQIAGG